MFLLHAYTGSSSATSLEAHKRKGHFNGINEIWEGMSKDSYYRFFGVWVTVPHYAKAG